MTICKWICVICLYEYIYIYIYFFFSFLYVSVSVCKLIWRFWFHVMARAELSRLMTQNRFRWGDVMDRLGPTNRLDQPKLLLGYTISNVDICERAQVSHITSPAIESRRYRKCIVIIGNIRSRFHITLLPSIRFGYNGSLYNCINILFVCRTRN